MTSNDPIRQRLLAIVEPVCHASGCEVVDLRLKSDQGGWVLRVFVDVEPEPGAAVDPEWWKHGVDLTVCERLSRELSAVLDVEDPVPHAYSLEVSSPGIDRPLRTLAHFRRFVGGDVKITLAVPQGDRKNYKGRLVAVEPAEAAAAAPPAAAPAEPMLVVEVDGQPHRLRFADVDTARLVPDWDAVMKGDSGVGPRPANGHNKKTRPRRAPEHR